MLLLVKVLLPSLLMYVKLPNEILCILECLYSYCTQAGWDIRELVVVF